MPQSSQVAKGRLQVASYAPSEPESCSPSSEALGVRRARSGALALSTDEMRSLGYGVVDAIVAHLGGLAQRPVSPIGDGMGPAWGEPPPEQGMDPQAVLEQTREVLQHAVAHDHPRFFAMIPSPGNFVSAMADALASGFNIFAGLARMSPASNRVEMQGLEWLRTLLGLDAGTSGLFVNGAAAASLLSIVVAREHVLGSAPEDFERARIYCSTMTHPVIDRGAKIAGLGPSCVRRLPVRTDLRLSLATLEQEVRLDRAVGLRPFLVVANAGTTDSGTVDDLEAIARFCRAEGLWMHVDGAYGAAAALTARGRRLLRGLELADSLAIDPHKWLFQPYELGCLLLRRPQLLEKSLRLRASYFDDTEAPDRPIDFKDRGIQLTRSLKALKLWMSLKTFGVAAFRRAIDHGMDLALIAEDELRKHAGWEVVTEPQLAILTFRYHPPGSDPDAAAELHRRLCQDLADSGFAMVNTTVVRGVSVLRMCTIHPSATEADVRAVVRWLARRAAELR